MKYYVVIPAYNEEQFLSKTLDSLTAQTLLPSRVVVVNDNSSDDTEKIIDYYSGRFPFIQKCNTLSKKEHASGSKVVLAFNKGLSLLDNNFQFVVKLDADIVLPVNYFQEVSTIFSSRKSAGIVGGFAYEKNADGDWIRQHPMNKDHVRGGFKAYSASCFKAIGGIKPAIGWDTVDELLARYHGYEIITLDALHVKHLRPLGSSYSRKSWIAQGEALYRMRYGWILAIIATLKMAVKHGKSRILLDNLKGYSASKKMGISYLVSEEEGRFIRRFRWRNITKKLF